MLTPPPRRDESARTKEKGKNVDVALTAEGQIVEIEQAGGLASTGRARILDITPEDLHQRIALIFGAREEVERIEQYHRDHNVVDDEAPLYGTRGLFRT